MGKARLLMKGSLHSDELLGAVTHRERGLRTGRRISHVFVMDVRHMRRRFSSRMRQSTSRRISWPRRTSSKTP